MSYLIGNHIVGIPTRRLICMHHTYPQVRLSVVRLEAQLRQKWTLGSEAVVLIQSIISESILKYIGAKTIYPL